MALAWLAAWFGSQWVVFGWPFGGHVWMLMRPADQRATLHPIGPINTETRHS